MAQATSAFTARVSPRRAIGAKARTAEHLPEIMAALVSTPTSPPSARAIVASRPALDTAECQSCIQAVSTATARVSPFSATALSAVTAATRAATIGPAALSPSMAILARAARAASRTETCVSINPVVKAAKASLLPTRAAETTASTACNLAYTARRPPCRTTSSKAFTAACCTCGCQSTAPADKTCKAITSPSLAAQPNAVSAVRRAAIALASKLGPSFATSANASTNKACGPADMTEGSANTIAIWAPCTC
mmetsp:Transcript_86841/g.218616  ORF Transcript_86841/g.218616 Transcript_86841/m.218616 type:complete len:252 (-) Transcript_86841:15-770(-)